MFADRQSVERCQQRCAAPRVQNMHAYLLRYVSAAEVLRAGARLASLVSRCDSCERCRCDADADAMPWSA
jgi:hypothetical protein